MSTRLKAVLPLTLSIGLLAFLASELALNFTFHWVTVQDGVFGKYGLPQGTHLVLPALFVAWGLYFLLGAHLIGAFKHQWFDHVPTLQRMTFRGAAPE